MSGNRETVQVAVTSSADAVDISVAGELDLSSADAVRRSIDDALAHKPTRVRFDLAGLDFMDSTGLSLFLTVSERVETVEIVNATPLVRELIQMTGLADTLRLMP